VIGPTDADLSFRMTTRMKCYFLKSRRGSAKMNHDQGFEVSEQIFDFI
jgi:hypothetical protein